MAGPPKEVVEEFEQSMDSYVDQYSDALRRRFKELDEDGKAEKPE